MVDEEGAVEPIVPHAWDTHVHAGPDVVRRRVDVMGLARAAESFGMGGIVLKNHHFPTAMVAGVAATAVEGDLSFAGTLVLNRSVGGLNLDAVKAAYRLGAKRLELPTMTAKHNMIDQQEPRTIGLLNGGGLSETCREVLDAGVRRDMVIGTGHVGVKEVEQVIEYVTGQGGRVLVTHPELHVARDGVGMPPERQADLARDGVYFERCVAATQEELVNHLLPDAPTAAREAFEGEKMWTRLVEGIKATGAANNVVSTDFGQPGNPPPPMGLVSFHERLLEEGISRRQLAVMARENPNALFG